MNKDVKKLIIFPDIHGRDFWKLPYRNHKDDPTFGFLFTGDYIDPYDFDGISKEDAWNNLIVMRGDFAGIPDDRQDWLVGNHDVHYFKQFHKDWGCRRDNTRLKDMDNFLNSYNFKVAHEEIINGKRYIFTHAGIRSKWGNTLVHQKLTNNPEDVWNVDFLNSLLKTERGRNALMVISRYRGGWHWDGSCVWADIDEHLNMLEWEKDDIYNKLNIYQIFGHSLSYPTIYGWYKNDCFAMLDCELPFILDLETSKLQKYIDFIHD